MEQKCKLIETCVLYIDMRKSTELNLTHKRQTLAKLYSAFIRSMAQAGSYFGGKVRNVVGDRLMILFDKASCFKNAVDTAILMNSVGKYIINKHFTHNEVSFGIGIDHGKMLVTKGGIVKYGIENANYKSLVWLGRPANVASKLTDAANKISTHKTVAVAEDFFRNYNWTWTDTNPIDFVQDLTVEGTTGTFGVPTPRRMKHKSSDFVSFLLQDRINSAPSTLITEDVLNGFKREAPDDVSIKEKMWTPVTHLTVPGYSGVIFGGGIIFTIFED
jgi:class 3 adenylate cyclase